MKLKSTLWTLAFACAAVSCSDDINNGPNNNENNNELEGPTTLITVSINPGVETKADLPSGGEEGDVAGGEEGLKSEYEVNDVTVVLFANADGSEPTEFKADSKLIGAGYANGLKTETGDEAWHNYAASVTITITDKNEVGFDGNTYGLITVTNLGSEDILKNRIHEEDLTMGYQLANLLQEKVYDGSNGFIMSTHNDTYGTGASAVTIMDKVTLIAGVDQVNAPHADVHVERLAAKIRITEQTDVEDFVYTMKADAASSLGAAKVRLDEVAIVNQLNSGTYLLKRVTANAAEKEIPSPDATSGYDYFLFNENATAGGAGLNYVIDPWTRGKDKVTPTAGNLEERDAIIMENGTATLSYVNDFYAPEDADNNKNGYYSELWASLSGATKLAANTAFADGNKSLDLCYTQENTTSAAMSLNGYSTGALFKATYFPQKYMAVVNKTTTATGETVMTQEVKAVDIDYNGEDQEGSGYDDINKDTQVENITFYVHNQKIYNGYEAIFNEFVWNQQKNLDGNENNTPIYSYASFKAGEIEKIKKQDFFKHLLTDFSDPLGYIEQLKKQCDADGDGILDAGIDQDAVFAVTDNIDDFIEANQITLNKTIKVYDNCVCYYPYWIRHANNNKFPNMGIMEFGIVRNNIYDLTVNAFKTLGLSGVDKPEPGDPDEPDKYYFNVNIKVKNWVVRKNSDIIL